MSVQFNLLPDVKLQYVKTQAVRRRVTTISAALSAAALGLFILLLVFVYGLQKKQMSDAAKSIDQASQQLKGIPGLANAITVDNQLKTLVSLHQNKHMPGRIFDYLAQLTPVNVSIGQLDMDMTTNTMNISGNADSQRSVNTFIDTLKATTYKVGSGTPSTAFPSVVESDFTINAGNVSYKLNLQFDPNLFANSATDAQGRSQAPSLNVPSSQKPTQSDIFQSQRGGQ